MHTVWKPARLDHVPSACQSGSDEGQIRQSVTSGLSSPEASSAMKVDLERKPQLNLHTG